MGWQYSKGSHNRHSYCTDDCNAYPGIHDGYPAKTDHRFCISYPVSNPHGRSYTYPQCHLFHSFLDTVKDSFSHTEPNAHLNSYTYPYRYFSSNSY